MAELRNLLVTSFMVILQTIKDSTCKSATLNLNLAPEWKAEISRRASDYGNLLLNLENLIGFGLIWMISLYVNRELRQPRQQRRQERLKFCIFNNEKQ